MQTSGHYGARFQDPRLECRSVQSYCVGIKEDVPSVFGGDIISIKGVTQEVSSLRSPRFVAVLEDRIASFLI